MFAENVRMNGFYCPLESLSWKHKFYGFDLTLESAFLTQFKIVIKEFLSLYSTNVEIIPFPSLMFFHRLLNFHQKESFDPQFLETKNTYPKYKKINFLCILENIPQRFFVVCLLIFWYFTFLLRFPNIIKGIHNVKNAWYYMFVKASYISKGGGCSYDGLGGYKQNIIFEFKHIRIH